MSSCVLDSSAVLAYLQQEDGYRAVAQRLDEASISTVNVAELLGKLAKKGGTEARLRQLLPELGLTVVPFEESHAIRAALLRPLTAHLGLSLGDRACLATAEVLGVPVLTTDRSWKKLRLGVSVEVIR